jgi:predicted Zn-dependent peptidase
MELDRAKESPARVIRNYFNKALYKDHPYGSPVTGTGSSVSRIRVVDLKTFYQAHYIPSQSAIAVVGDFEIEDLKKKLEAYFSDWSVSDTAIPTMPIEFPLLGTNRVLLVNKDDAHETQFLIGNYGIKQSNPDYIAVQVVNTILGGRFTSWLNDELRVNRGLTYGARSFFSTYKHSGVFAMSSYTRTEKTVEAVDVTLEILDRLHDQGVDEETLKSAKNYIRGQFPPRYETSGTLASLLTSMFVYGFDESYINDFQKNVEAMTVDKSKEIIDKYFSRDHLQFVLIGKAASIRDQVKKYGDLLEKEIKADGF